MEKQNMLDELQKQELELRDDLIKLEKEFNLLILINKNRLI